MSDTLLSAAEDLAQFFRLVHGRRLATLSETYPLPVDIDEEKRQELFHRQMQFIFSGKNWVGPVKEALQFGEKRRSKSFPTPEGTPHTLMQCRATQYLTWVLGRDTGP